MALRRRTDPPPWRFFLRWGAAVAVSVIAASLILYGFTSHGLERRLLQESSRGYAAQARGLEQILAGGTPTTVTRQALQSEVSWMGRAYGTAYVGLSDASGTLIAASGTPGSGPDPVIRHSVVASMRPLLPDHAVPGPNGQDRFEFLLPIASPRGALVLQVDEDARIVGRLVYDLRARSVRSLLLVILLAVPISYLLGGHGLHRRQRAAERTANTDALTGVYGRRRFEPILSDALASPSNASVALALIDIDNFKQVNDQLGHSHGDLVLVALARSFTQLRDVDTAFRTGGDEFAVVLPDTDDGRACAVLARVVAALNRAMPTITVSCGIASAGRHDGVSAQDLWERADRMLYEAKRLGRNQMVTFSTSASSARPTRDAGRNDARGASVECEAETVSAV